MALRFIDTGIWDTVWFRKLNPVEKALYFYLVTRCDHAGLYEVDLETAGYFIGEKIENPKDFLSENFNIVEISDNKWFLIDFLKLQYPKGLNSEKPAIISVKNKLKEYGLLEMIIERFGNDYLTIKDMDKDMDTDMDTDKNKEVDTDKDKNERELTDRLLKFENELEPFFREGNKKILTEFLNYWTDIVDFEGDKKMKFETKSGFDMKKELKDWLMNEVPPKKEIKINQ